MKNKNRILAIIISSIYAITLAVYIIYLATSYSGGQKKASATFKSLTQVTSNILYASEPGTQHFVDLISSSQDLKEIFDTQENLAGMQLAVGENLIYSNPGDLSKSPAAKSSLVRFYSTSLNSKMGTAVTLNCAIYLLTPQTIYNGGKVAFMIILAFTVICAFVILFSYWSSYEDSEHSAEKSLERSLKEQANSILAENQENEEVPASEPSSYENDQLDQISDWTYQKLESAGLNSYDNTSQASLSSQTEDSQEDVVLEYKDDRPNRDELFSGQDIEDVTSTFFDDEPEEEQQDSEDTDSRLPIIDTSDEQIQRAGLSFVDDTETASSPSGLFSPETGFGWESYLNTRLSSELVRAASQESDLSVLSIRIPGLQKGTMYAKAIYTLILDTVKFQDLVFEKGDDGCIALFQDTTIDQAISIADRLHSRIQEILDANGLNSVCGMGISSKSLRLISAERLTLESNQAMNYALEDTTSPIVAYRVNPEKYRNYLNND